MGLLKQSDVESPPSFPIGLVDFPAVIQFKSELLRKAYTAFRDEHGDSSFDYSHFCEDNARWLDNYALFNAISEQFSGQTWGQWPKELRDRQYDALKKSSEELHDVIEMEKFTQFLFSKQWSALKNYCNRKGIQIIGDLPVYVDYNSAEVWAHPEFFKLDQDKRPYVVSGVPPDYFSATGQLWGHPIYNWDKLRETGYSWWLDRIEHNLNQCDILRIDHFRGFVAFWEVPAEEKTAINGKWVQGPADDFFKKVLRRFPGISIIAEDLGVITPDVRELIRELGVPGMKVLMFAFGEYFASNPYAPHNIPKDSVVFTGTHDNNTVKGWFRREATPEDKNRFSTYVGREIGEDEIHTEMCRLAMMSVANIAILPMQDILGLGEEARMNLPSKKEGNWLWRLSSGMLTPEIALRLRTLTETYGRA